MKLDEYKNLNVLNWNIFKNINNNREDIFKIYNEMHRNIREKLINFITHI